ncbi:MAG: aminotransferase class V-fold PLP-dependent enzyme [bacterium]
MKRRNFLKQSSQGLVGFIGAGLLLRSKNTIARPKFNPPQGEVEPHDEKFWSLVREQFPLTKDRIYLNNGGLGPSPYVVIDAVRSKISELERISETGHSEKLWHSIKGKAAQILGCYADEIAYTRNATEGINIVCNGLPLKRGDEVITTTHEHVGNTIAWLARQKRDGITIKVFEPSTESASENLERIERLITKRTRALSLPHVTTSTGQILAVKEIGELAAKHNLWYFLDGAQSAGMIPLNVHEIGCHAFAASGHKWLLGPKGTGLLYVRQDMLDVVEAKWVGAYSNTGNFDMATGEFHFHPTAQRYEYGTVSTPLFVGLAAAIEFLLKIGMKNVWRRNFALAEKLQNGLNELGAEVLSPQHPDEHSAMITFRMPNISRQKLQSFLAKKFKLRTRGVYEGGLDGVRISLHIYNSFAEVDRILEGVTAAKTLTGF